MFPTFAYTSDTPQHDPTVHEPPSTLLPPLQRVWRLKPYGNQKPYEAMLQKCYDDQSIGLNYSVTVDLTRCANVAEMVVATNGLDLAPNTLRYMDAFINKARINDTFIICRGHHEAKAICRFTSSAYFEPHTEKWQDGTAEGFYHRRRFVVQAMLPAGSHIRRQQRPTICLSPIDQRVDVEQRVVC